MITTTRTHETEKDAISCIRHRALAQVIKDMDEMLRMCVKYEKSIDSGVASEAEIEWAEKMREKLHTMLSDNDLWFLFRYDEDV